jgi:DMSO/TMAO reductase YedYZ molybdopterin-dependent catalytic subunit
LDRRITEARIPIKPITIERNPYNAETPPQALRKDITSTSYFYVRNHFRAPIIDAASWRLKITGAVEHELTLSLKEIKSLRAKTLSVTLECAGNGRTHMTPCPPGTPWRDGAIGTATWTGVPLRSLLAKTHPTRNAIEVLFRGADHGLEEEGGGNRLSFFERSLPLAIAEEEDVILAYKMNGRPLDRMHGYPLRLIVPRWYGVASVKWLKEICVLREPFRGWFQTQRYVYQHAYESKAQKKNNFAPVREMRVKSLILEPNERANLALGESHVVSGLAWSGQAEIKKVLIRINRSNWKQANLLGHNNVSPYTWRRWSIDWKPRKRGEFTITSKASDKLDNAQPAHQVLNLHGYGYNTQDSIKVKVT